VYVPVGETWQGGAAIQIDHLSGGAGQRLDFGGGAYSDELPAFTATASATLSWASIVRTHPLMSNRSADSAS
jgi:hypothetical protein